MVSACSHILSSLRILRDSEGIHSLVIDDRSGVISGPNRGLIERPIDVNLGAAE